VVNTHHHWDHSFGNAVFRPVPIWGHERCAERMRDEGTLTRDKLGLGYPTEAEWFGEVEIVPPDRTFDVSADLDCGSRRIGLRYLGLAHTDNDIVVVVDDGDVVFAGDLVEQAAPPFFGDGYPLEWPAVCERLLDLIRGAVVPGHGAVVDRAFVEEQASEVAEVAYLAAERHAAGMPAADAARAGGPFGAPTLADAFGRAWEHLDRGDPAPSRP
jgi:glyoxylase-like metal-dependent hydrolase (beta-lactamase superfamily II)